MHFDEADEGDYRIYAGAREAQGAGYVAAVVVSRVRGVGNKPREAYRDEDLGCGYVWDSPSRALSYALTRARAVIASERHLLAC